MPNSSSLVAHHGSNASIEAEATTSTTRSADDPGPSYSLNHYLADTSHHPPGYGSARNTTEAEERMLEELRKFEAKFSSSSDALHRN